MELDIRDQDRRALYEWISRRWWDKRQHALLPEDGGSLRFVFAAEAGEDEKHRVMADQIEALEGSYTDWTESPIEVFDTDDPHEFVIYFRHGFGHATGSPTQDIHESEFILIYRIENGKIIHIDEYFNPLEIMKTMGKDVGGAVLMRDSQIPEPPFW